MSHAFLSPSASARWLKCTRAPAYEAQYPDEATPYAEEGTLAHALAEKTAAFYLNYIDEAEYNKHLEGFKASDFFTQEMFEVARSWAELILDKVNRRTNAEAFLEVQLKLDKYVPESFGTADCIIISEECLEVIDLKYGKGVAVKAQDNTQMKLYALGAIDQFEALYEIVRVQTTIYQPRLAAKPDTAEVLISNLMEWGETYVRPRAELAMKGEGKFAPSEETCRFCKFKYDCKARAIKQLDLYDNNDPNVMTTEEAAFILEQAADMKAWLSDLEEKVFGELLAGEPVKGWKLVEGRSIRKLGAEAKVVKALTDAGIDKKLLYTKTLITLSQMEKDFGKKFVDEALGDLITKPQGKPTLAPESDKRPAISLLDDFDK